ncbi:Pentatricopeptide repeat-containing protein [Acorus gramineus]|uniref:Pentatricopeptide repeat-containing protein n=1 Tax=Acorus gramineus TaxID=55184 RepID=A0AAV9BXM0_ACOGR|nr:Pentatricopeptide repeat-containing protein [Acorus gramineus]
MEVPLSRSHITQFDQLRNTQKSFSCALFDPNSHKHENMKFLSGSDVFPRKRKSLSCIKISLVNQSLQPKPRPKQKPKDEFRETQIEKAESLNLCGHIEKLVLFKRFKEALELFESMVSRDSNTVVGSSTYESLVNACIGSRSIRGVKRLYIYIVENGFEPDQYLMNRILLVHVKCGMIRDARMLFDEMKERNFVSWNIMIGGLIDLGEFREAFQLFSMMRQEIPDVGSRTFAIMMRASAGLEIAFTGQQLHALVTKLGMNGHIFISCAQIDMYSKCGCIDDARCVFDGMPEKTVVGWNSIIAGYALHGYSEEALDLYHEMRSAGVKMDHFTYSIIIRICARLASLEHAKQAHAGLMRSGFAFDTVSNTALVDFYSKWGRLEDARRVFDRMPRKNVFSWNALIAGYGNHGRGIEAVELYERMIREGIAPTHVTFLAVLGACGYSGLSDKAWKIIDSMREQHEIEPRAMHYACMIELLGREGLLDQALALIRDTPFEPTANMWAALLTACRIHGNVELGRYAAEVLVGMEPQKLSNYIVLLNIYKSLGRLNEVARVMEILKRREIVLLPACSWIEVKKKPYVFHFGDKSHAKSEEICTRFGELMEEIVKVGYVPNRKVLLPDVEEKDQILTYHSEKLAIAFGLISTTDSTSLLVVQSHRICEDCHLAIKLIAMVTGREIVVRDASRFHHFKHGACSCGDYW